MSELTFYEALAGLFSSAFVSATLFPGASEAVLLALDSAWPEAIWLALSVATVANTLGSMTSYILGRFFPKKVSAQALQFINRWGACVLLFDWVPVLGDALPIAAEWLRITWFKSSVLILQGKG